MPHRIMTPRIDILNEKKLIGNYLTMSYSNYNISALWQTFMPNRSKIVNNTSNDLISLTIYKPTHFINFKLTNEFVRWAAMEVADFDNIPVGMDTFVLPSGLYAIFDYKGLSTDNSIFKYILESWLPNSSYILDNRPHFEVLGDKYKNNDPTSEEAICIPIRLKK